MNEITRALTVLWGLYEAWEHEQRAKLEFLKSLRKEATT